MIAFKNPESSKKKKLKLQFLFSITQGNLYLYVQRKINNMLFSTVGISHLLEGVSCF